ncbi:hypothetical protein A2153_04005 [Candidatus Gottesmanbacteria bacterium RBG_16_38_7b]|uniref:Uncharacterized protein n=1 Tax=Candidatus Gottesmanbacteria bacterium RBG_16_38_7b TaxID=1798372 RepID=A0A1F5YI71_9BACT|nr:MAG: hypothetical protein A2153_04005 [Candidatus Gottesmanbacteria bacterium RBG_16_38_7b]
MPKTVFDSNSPDEIKYKDNLEGEHQVRLNNIDDELMKLIREDSGAVWADHTPNSELMPEPVVPYPYEKFISEFERFNLRYEIENDNRTTGFSMLIATAYDGDNLRCFATYDSDLHKWVWKEGIKAEKWNIPTNSDNDKPLAERVARIVGFDDRINFKTIDSTIGPNFIAYNTLTELTESGTENDRQITTNELNSDPFLLNQISRIKKILEDQGIGYNSLFFVVEKTNDSLGDFHKVSRITLRLQNNDSFVDKHYSVDIDGNLTALPLEFAISLLPEFHPEATKPFWGVDFENGVTSGLFRRQGFNGSGTEHWLENQNSKWEIVPDPVNSGRGKVLQAVASGPPPIHESTGNGDTHRAYPDLYEWDYGVVEGPFNVSFDFQLSAVQNNQLKIFAESPHPWLNIASMFSQTINSGETDWSVSVPTSYDSKEEGFRTGVTSHNGGDFLFGNLSPLLPLLKWMRICMEVGSDKICKLAIRFDGEKTFRLVSTTPYGNNLKLGINGYHGGIYGGADFRGRLLNDNVTINIAG